MLRARKTPYLIIISPTEGLTTAIRRLRDTSFTPRGRLKGTVYSNTLNRPEQGPKLSGSSFPKRNSNLLHQDAISRSMSLYRYNGSWQGWGYMTDRDGELMKFMKLRSRAYSVMWCGWSWIFIGLLRSLVRRWNGRETCRVELGWQTR